MLLNFSTFVLLQPQNDLLWCITLLTYFRDELGMQELCLFFQRPKTRRCKTNLYTREEGRESITKIV